MVQASQAGSLSYACAFASTERGTDKSSQRAVADACRGREDLIMNRGVPQENAAKVRTNGHQIRTYAELQEQLHRDLLAQHPEWIDADGNCPTCDSYDRRLAELITCFESGTRKSVPQLI